ncbi:MAG: class I SAM-dependent methyltransferase [Phycisphaerales bacterium]|nr:class I SAM-dependent methyltransferase [Phycisphaerales bacterium]
MTTDALYRAVQACYEGWSGRYHDEYYGDAAPYPPVHVDLIRDLLRASRPATLLDAGCGPATVLRALDDLAGDRFGFDLTPAMVDEARRVLAPQNVPDSHVWCGNVVDAAAFRCPDPSAPPTFDATLCIGVLPHIPADRDDTVLDHLCASVSSGGRLIVEARNALFALFTFNRYTRAFVTDALLRLDARRAAADATTRAMLDDVESDLASLVRDDLPPRRRGDDAGAGYDDILSRTHNPFELAAACRARGLRDVEVLFYHYHALPPMFESRAPAYFRELSLAMEDPRDWRGHVMASAFLVTGVAP